MVRLSIACFSHYYYCFVLARMVHPPSQLPAGTLGLDTLGIMGRIGILLARQAILKIENIAGTINSSDHSSDSQA